MAAVWQKPNRKTKKVKYKTPKFRASDSTYFHHRHGTFVRKNRKRSFALSMSALTIMFGGFFVGKEYAWPMLSNNAQVQRVQQLTTDKIISAEADPNNKNAQPIRQEDELLKSAIEDTLATYPTDQKWSVFVYDLNTERTVNINTDEAYASASLYKLFLLEALEEKLPFDQWQWTWVGNSSIQDCVNTMLKGSDNPCAQELGEYIGWDKIDELNSKNGYKSTSLADNGRETTASDLGELLAKLKRGETLSDYARRFVFDSLYQQKLNKGMAKACKDCRTANKLGELSDVAHDAGIVTHGTHDYVLVVMSEGGSFDQIEALSKLIENKLVPKL